MGGITPKKCWAPVAPKLVITILAAAILLTSCGYPLVRTVEVTRVVPQTVVVTELLVVVETATPASLTTNKSTSASTTPQPFIRWTIQQVWIHSSQLDWK